MSAFPIDGAKVRTLRENKEWTQARLAERIGGDCTDKTISRIETKNTTTLEMAGNIAAALGTSVADLRLSGEQPVGANPLRDADHTSDLREVVELLNRRESVHILLADGIQQGAVIAQLVALVPRLALIDFENPVTAARPGLLGEIVRLFGGKVTISPQKPDDLVDFGRYMEALREMRVLTITHFDRINDDKRKEEYEHDLFHALRYYTMTNKVLVLLLVGRKPFGELLPPDHELSHINLTTIELRPTS